MKRFALFVLGLAVAPIAHAVVPGEVNFQGLLLDDVGVPVTATVAMDFELFDAASSGTSLWTESHASVQVVNGVYNVTLGETTPITAALVAGGSLHLEITIDSETLTPRQQLLVVPYALRSAVSENTEQVDGFEAGYMTEMLQHFSFDGEAPDNLDPREGLGDADGDGAANFIDADNDNDGINDGAELAQGSDINLITPTIAGYSPPTADGFETTTVQVQGSSFQAGQTVAFGSENPTPTNLTSTTFDVQVGPQPEGTVAVSVTLPNAESTASTFDFFFITPTIAGYSPPTADGFETTTVQVQGTSFQTGQTVAFGSENPTPTNLTSTTFDVQVGPQPEGTVAVSVTLPNAKSAASTFDFFFLEPQIDSFEPFRFDENQAGTVTVMGQNFIAGMTVQFGGQNPTPSNITATSFDLSIAGTEPPGFVSVTATLPNGKDTTNTTGFEVLVGSPRVIFATSTTQDGNLGGLSGADATCNSLASAAGLPGTFQAWLADSTQSPSTRESQAGAPYIRSDPSATVIANDWADLTDGDIDVAVSLDENGVVAAPFDKVWANVTAVGAGAESTNHCGDWTINNSNSEGLAGRHGLRNSATSSWTQEFVGSGCMALLYLYCVEQ